MQGSTEGDGDVRTEQDAPSSRIGSRFSCSPSRTLTHPSPVRVNSEHRMGFTLGDFPAGKIPAGALTEVQIHLRLGFGHADGGSTILHRSWYRDSYSGSGALALGEAQEDVNAPGESQYQSWAPVTIDFALYGYDAAMESVSYLVQSEPVVSPRSPRSRPTRSVARGPFKVPATAKKGVRLVGSVKGETAKAPLRVTLVKPTARFAKKLVKRGKKIALTGSKLAQKEKVKVTLEGASSARTPKALKLKVT